MQAMLLKKLVTISETSEPLCLEEVPLPHPATGEILIRVRTCGVCHTELDEIEGRLPPPNLPVIPGHQVVGVVVELGQGATEHHVGDRVGVGWIFTSTGTADENIRPEFRATGYDVNGGYAEYLTVPARYAYSIPATLSDTDAAPLLCGGAIGARALRLTNLQDGEPLGLTGFGGSGHLTLQLARYRYPNSPVFVFARSAETRQFALSLGADWAGETWETPPERPQAIIDTTPAWTPVVAALRTLRPGGRLVINAIRKENADRESLLKLSYHEDLWLEREIKTVANITGRDIQEFLKIAGELAMRPTVETYRLAEANRALRELKNGSVKGAKVLVISEI